MVEPLEDPGTKVCARCREEFPRILEFYYFYPDGAISSYCRPCAVLIRREWRAANPEASREQARRSVRKWREADPERALEYQRQWAADNPERIKAYQESQREKDMQFDRRAQRRHGILPAQTALLLDFQEGVCCICQEPIARRPENGENQLVIDHDHETGYVRGLLCNGCNVNLGWAEARLDRVLDYLSKPPAEQLGLEIISRLRRINPAHDSDSGYRRQRNAGD